MTKIIKCYGFKPLAYDMKFNHIDKEHYTFTYNGFAFDVIFSIVENGYEILAAIHLYNWGCVLYVDENFSTEVRDEIYYPLRRLLGLNWNEHHFNSSAFLSLLSKNAPSKSSKKGVGYKQLYKFIRYRPVDESKKCYFKGWNDHTKDGNTAHNFDKTEFFLGKSVADYCRLHNISSIWTDRPREEEKVTLPWSI